MAEEKDKGKAKKVKKPTALKRDIQNSKKNLRNKAFKTKVKTALNILKKGIVDKDSKENLQPKLNAVYSLFDKGVKKGIFKKNRAARFKQTYSARMKAV